MNILYIHQYFNTPDKPGGTRSYWNSLELLKNGKRVIVICSNYQISEKIKREVRDGIEIISLKVPYSQSMSLLSRFKSFVDFMLKATWIALKEKNIDLVIATSTPLTIGFPALVLKKMKKIPYLFEVRDLWPEVPIQMGGLNNKLLIRLALWFEKTIYKNASHIVALSPGMKDGVLRTGVTEEKVTMIPNMAKIDEFWSRSVNLDVMTKHNLGQETFKIIYFGSLGEANGIDYIMETALLLKDTKEIQFLFVGNGSKKDFIIDTIKENKMENVKVLGSFAMEETSELVNICDVSLVTFTNIPILYTNSPNKLFDSLSAGKPIIVNSKGWTKKLVEDYECGLFVNPESAEDLVEKIKYLRENPAILKKMGLNSRKLAEKEFDKSILCKKFARVVNAIEV